jgi:hypothetical protein
MGAVLDKLEAMEAMDELPPMLGQHSARRGPLDVRAAPHNVVGVRQAVLVPGVPAPPDGRAEQRSGAAGYGRGVTPRGTPRFRKVAQVQQQAEERFRQSQRGLIFGDSQPLQPPPPAAAAPKQPFAIPPRPPAMSQSDVLLREFEQAWMEAGRTPSPARDRSLASTPRRTWRWRTASHNGIRLPRGARGPDVQRRVQTERLPQPQVAGGIDWDRALSELRREEQHALEMQLYSTQPLNTGLDEMQKSWKYFTTPGWILDNLDEPELYTYSLR